MIALLLHKYYYQLENSNAAVLAIIFKQNQFLGKKEKLY